MLNEGKGRLLNLWLEFTCSQRFVNYNTVNKIHTFRYTLYKQLYKENTSA